ncbi:hypothetical protein ACU4GD_27815 [Cupriavidus basilensis]
MRSTRRRGSAHNAPTRSRTCDAKAELLPKAQDSAARALAERDAFLPQVEALRAPPAAR